MLLYLTSHECMKLIQIARPQSTLELRSCKTCLHLFIIDIFLVLSNAGLTLLLCTGTVGYFYFVCDRFNQGFNRGGNHKPLVLVCVNALEV